MYFEKIINPTQNYIIKQIDQGHLQCNHQRHDRG